MEDKEVWKYLRIFIVVVGFIALALGIRAGWAFGTHYFDSRENVRTVDQ